jgi:hypothetical protein
MRLVSRSSACHTRCTTRIDKLSYYIEAKNQTNLTGKIVKTGEDIPYI